MSFVDIAITTATNEAALPSVPRHGQAGDRADVDLFGSVVGSIRATPGERMRFAVTYVLVVCIGTAASLVGPAHAQVCDDACYLIQNTFVPDILERYLKAFPASRYADLARSRIGYLNALAKDPKSGFGAVHIVPAQRYRASDVPASPID